MQWELEELQLKLRLASAAGKHILSLDLELRNNTVASEVPAASTQILFVYSLSNITLKIVQIETKAKAANLSKNSVEARLTQ